MDCPGLTVRVAAIAVKGTKKVKIKAATVTAAIIRINFDLELPLVMEVNVFMEPPAKNFSFGRKRSITTVFRPEDGRIYTIRQKSGSKLT